MTNEKRITNALVAMIVAFMHRSVASENSNFWAAVADYFLKTLRLHVSLGNSKLGRIPSVSFPPVRHCNPSAGCRKGGCYALKAWRQYPAVRAAWSDNLTLFERSPRLFGYAVAAWCQVNRPARFRWNVSGDAPSVEYFHVIAEVARLCQKTRFLCYTKQDGYLKVWADEFAELYQDFPINLTIRLSHWFDFTPSNTYAFPTAHIEGDGVTTLANDPLAGHYDVFFCEGDCRTCAACWRKDNIVVFQKH